jgi:hypothetical protein
MKPYVERKYSSTILDLGKIGFNSQFHVSATLPPRDKSPDTAWIGGWVGPMLGLDVMKQINRTSVVQSVP